MIRAVVFDLWNTLIHSVGGSPFTALQGLLQPDQQALFPAFKQDAMGRLHDNAPALLASWRDRLGLSDEQIHAMTRVWERAAEDALCYPDALQAVEETQRIARVALLSNTQSFDLAFLDRLPALACTSLRFLSAQTGFLKPQPEAFAHAQKKMGLFPGQIAMVGDSWNEDVQGALAAGWTVFWLNRHGKPMPALDEGLDGEFLIEIRDLTHIAKAVENLQQGARCSTCLG